MGLKFRSFILEQPRYSTVGFPVYGMDEYIERQFKVYGIRFVLDQPYQRDVVWSIDQQISYMEHLLRGGISGLDIWINQRPEINDQKLSDLEVVDGKQRITAVLRFLSNEIPAFDHYYNEFDGRIPDGICFVWHKLRIPTISECAKWYIVLNSTGVAHSKEDIERARKYV